MYEVFLPLNGVRMDEMVVDPPHRSEKHCEFNHKSQKQSFLGWTLCHTSTSVCMILWMIGGTLQIHR